MSANETKIVDWTLLQRNVGVFSRKIGQLFRSQDFQIVANDATSVLWFDNVVDKTSLGANHWVGKPLSIFSSVKLHILFIYAKNKVKKGASNNISEGVAPHDILLTLPEYRISVAPFAPITATSALGHA